MREEFAEVRLRIFDAFSRGAGGRPEHHNRRHRGSPTPMIVKITGAPGDGNTALALAIRNELARIGLPISDKARRPQYRLDVYVTVGKARDDGNQAVEVKWWLHNPEGKYQGTVMQRVELPDGELNGQWGNDATYAARGAAQGILRLLSQ